MPVNTAAGCTLIVGSDSQIGGALMAHLQRAGQPVIGTTRRHARVDGTHLYLNLSDDMVSWRCPLPVALAVICAGVTKLESCAQDVAGTARVNVHAICALVEQLVAAGAFVIYLSSNAVFDGSIPLCSPDAPLSPITEYGRQKAEVERVIGQWGTAVAVVRLTKVLGPVNPLLASWTRSLSDGEVIHPFSDTYMAPVPLSSVVSTLRLIGDLRLPGITQLSGERDLSYSEVASIGARLRGMSPALVQPVSVTQSDRCSEPVPTNTTLNIDRLRTALGLEPPDVLWTVKAAFDRPQVLAADG